MRAKHIIFFTVILCLITFGACKKSVPTGPNGDLSLEFSGRITLSGQGFSNVDVYLSRDVSQKKTTGADGRFSFTDFLTGDYIITPSCNGYSFNPSNYEVGSYTRKDLNFTASLASYGTGVGDIMANFTTRDQNNQNVSLYDFFGKVILIDFSYDTCGPCRKKAETAEAFYQEYRNKGFMYILIIIDGDPAAWAAAYDLTFPVLDDNSRDIYDIYSLGDCPLPHVLDRNCTIRYKREGWSEAIKAEVEEEINKYL